MPQLFLRSWSALALTIAAVFSLSVSTAAWAQFDYQDELIIKASEANQKNDSKSLLEILPEVKGHPMEAWVHYWSVRSRIKTATAEEVTAVFKRWPGSYVEDRLRNDWLLVLGEQQNWSTYSEQYTHFKMRDDSQVLCFALLADHLNKHDVAKMGQEEFLKLRPPYVAETGCNMLAKNLYAAKKMPESLIWTKARRQAELNRIAATQKTVAILGLGMDANVRDLMKDPKKWLTGQQASTASKVAASHSELITLALVRWAAKDPADATKAMSDDWRNELNEEQKAWVYAVAGRITAFRLNPQAVSYYDRSAHAKGLNDDTIEWHARALLRAAEISKKSSDWKKLVNVIDAMPEELRKSDAWVFWKAIAFKRVYAHENAEHPMQLQAKDMFESIAGYDEFYQQLATEELGQLISLPTIQHKGPTQEEMVQVADTAGLMRALYALKLGLRSEGNREWNWNLRGKDDRFLQAASQLACDQQIWDRCINTSERTKTLYNVGQRYPMPYRDIIVPKTSAMSMDTAYVFGLIRQESRFIADIKSSVGATGLMQLMPATAKWTAKEVGMTGYTPSVLSDPESNITLGTAYLKLSLDEFNGSQPLAAAAYNAGPSRSRNWRKGPTLDGAVWAENIPFNETRNYVKTVLSAAVVYNLTLTGQSQSLRARLNQIGPAEVGQGVKRSDLP